MLREKSENNDGGNDNNNTDDDTKRHSKYGYCPQCKKANHKRGWCNPCDRKALVDKFNTWSTGNKALDLFIQETQRTAESYDDTWSTYLEYVPYDRFTNVKPSGGLGDFTAKTWLDSRLGEVFTATWLDGKREVIKKEGIEDSWTKGRSEPLEVSLEVVVNSTKIDHTFIDELKQYYHQSLDKRDITIYGVTLDPETMNYALVYNDERSNRYGYCPQCKKANNHYAWCNPCDKKALVDKFNTWSTGNKALDLFIQETQRTATCYELNDDDNYVSYLEYVPYDWFTDVKSSNGLGDFTAKTWLDSRSFTATWLDGVRKRKWSSNDYGHIKGRSSPLEVSLEVVVNSIKIDHTFVDELKHQYHQSNESDITIYGVTLDPETMNYALVYNDKRYSFYGYCPQCKKANTFHYWCNPCDRKALVDKFNTWSTGNKTLDLFIQETQRTATCYGNYLEYVPYDRFTNVKLLARGGFAKVFTAKWLNGERIIKRKLFKKGWFKGRTKPFTVVLKMIENSEKMEESFINELRLHYQFYQEAFSEFLPCYGITQDPETKNYALILEYFPDGDLRRRLINNSNNIRWNYKLYQLYNICVNLRNIHDHDYVHRDIHSGNILIKHGYFTYLTDFGLTQPATDSAHSTKTGTYGVIPYMAPELFCGEPHSKASDVYAMGIIMSEYASNELAFYDRDHDVHLQLEIIDGLRPEVPPETPKCYKDLMNQCLSGNPSDRPTVNELEDLFYRWRSNIVDHETKQFEIADEQWKPKQQPKKKHPGAVYTSRLITHVTTVRVGAASTSSMLPTSRASDLEIDEA